MILRLCLILKINLSNHELKKLTDSLLFLLNWSTSEGSAGIKRWKTISDSCLRWCLLGTTTGFKVRNRGQKATIHPKFKWITWYKRSFNFKILVLTLLCFHRYLRSTPKIDLSSIVSPVSVPIRYLLKCSWSIILQKQIFSLTREFCRADRLKGPLGEFFLSNQSEKSGPNGTAFHKTEDDFVALWHQPLLGLCLMIEFFCQRSYLTDLSLRRSSIRFLLYNLKKGWWRFPGIWWSRLKGQKPSLIHSKLIGLSDKSGKTRVIAICDWWSQTLMRPLHDQVFRYLRTLDTDGTYDQDKQRNRVQQWTSGKYGNVFSYDLSSATDRFPVVIQALCLYLGGFLNFWGSVRWWVIMSRRLFWIQMGRRFVKVRYAVGQPMGLYSSWAALAYTHHVIIWFACAINGKDYRRFKRYALLGDDIVIADETVAKTYYFVMTSLLGVSINKDKSFQSSTVAEFAKSLFVGGLNVSPLSWDLLSLRRVYYWQDVLLLLEEVSNRKIVVTLRDYWNACLFESGPGIDPDVLLFLLTCPYTRVNWSHTFLSPFGDWDQYTAGYIEYLQASSRTSSYDSELALGVLQKLEVDLPWLTVNPHSDLDYHPLVVLANNAVKHARTLGLIQGSRFRFCVGEGFTSYFIHDPVGEVTDLQDWIPDYHPLTFRGVLPNQQELKIGKSKDMRALTELRKELPVSAIIRISKLMSCERSKLPWLLLYFGEEKYREFSRDDFKDWS